MHTDQITIDTEAARALVHAQFPAFRGDAVKRLEGSGTEHTIFRVGQYACARFPLRMTDPDRCAAALRAQAAAMTLFAENSPVPAPRPLGVGRPGPGYPLPWLMVTWVDGDCATPAGLAGSAAFALDLAHVVAGLRRVATQGRVFDGQGRGGRLPDHDAWMRSCLDRSGTLIDGERVARLWGRLRLLPDPPAVVMSHRDLIPGNLLVRGERVAGVLDTGQFGPADPALDLVVAWHLLDEDRRLVFRRRLGADDTEWRRGAAWALQQAMGLVWYYRATNPAMSALGLSTVTRILADAEL